MKNQRGVAMLMAIIAMTILAILTAELVYQVGVYQRMVYNQIDELRAQHLAMSAIRIAKLQLAAAEKGKIKLKSLGAKNLESLVNRIWQTPIVLPPPIPASMGSIAKDSLNEFQQNLGLNGQLSVQIFGESDRINLNQLVWPPEIKVTSDAGVATGGVPVGGSGPAASEEEKRQVVHDRFKLLIEAVLDKKKFDDNLFRERYGSLQAEDLLLNLEAWMSPKVAVANEESVYVSGVEKPYGIKNAPMQTMSELYMVKGFDETLVKLFSDYFTTSFTSGVNINKVSGELLHALLPELDERTLDAILVRRNDPNQGGPFGSVDDFWAFVKTQGDFERLSDQAADRGVVFVTEETSYRVVVTAESSNAKKTWVAIFGPPPPDLTQPPPNTVPNIDTPTPGSSKGKSDKNENDNKIPSILYLKTDG